MFLGARTCVRRASVLEVATGRKGSFFAVDSGPTGRPLLARAATLCAHCCHNVVSRFNAHSDWQQTLRLPVIIACHRGLARAEMMSWEAAGALGEIIGAIAVLLTLAYLATQVRQNSRSLRAASYQAWAETKARVLTAVTEEPTLAQALTRLGQHAEMSESEGHQVAHWMHLIVHVAETAYYLHLEGVLGDEIWATEMRRSAVLIRDSEMGRQWWEVAGRTQFTPEFVSAIEEFASTEEPSYKLFTFTQGVGYHAV